MIPTDLKIGCCVEGRRRICTINDNSCYVTTPDIGLIENICQEHRPHTVKELDKQLQRLGYRAFEIMKRSSTSHGTCYN